MRSNESIHLRPAGELVRAIDAYRRTKQIPRRGQGLLKS